MSRPSVSRVSTKVYKSVLCSDTATFAYEYLRDTIQWEAGIKSKHGATRLAKAVDPMEDEVLAQIVDAALTKSGMELRIYSAYLNYYRDGSMYTPNHSHPGTIQIIISLGQTRTLTIGKKSYAIENGDVAIFGGSVHGVPKDKSTEGRISVALFAQRL